MTDDARAALVERADTGSAWDRQNQGLPQKFPLLSKVKVKQDGSAPTDWSGDWVSAVLTVVGVQVDPHRSGRLVYWVEENGAVTDGMDEDWLEPIDAERASGGAGE